MKETQNGDSVSRWLLDGDPAIRWQVLRDVLGAAERTLRALRVLKWWNGGLTRE